MLCVANAADVEIFTRLDCGERMKAKEYLRAHRIEFVERAASKAVAAIFLWNGVQQ